MKFLSSRYRSKIKSSPKPQLTNSNSDSHIIYVTPATTSERPLLETEPSSHYSPSTEAEHDALSDLSSPEYYRVKVTTYAPSAELRKKIQAATSVNNLDIETNHNDDEIASSPHPTPSHIVDDIYLSSSEIPETLVKFSQPQQTHHKIVKVLSNNALAVGKVKKPSSHDYDYSNDDDGESIALSCVKWRISRLR